MPMTRGKAQPGQSENNKSPKKASDASRAVKREAGESSKDSSPKRLRKTSEDVQEKTTLEAQGMEGNRSKNDSEQANPKQSTQNVDESNLSKSKTSEVKQDVAQSNVNESNNAQSNDITLDTAESKVVKSETNGSDVTEVSENPGQIEDEGEHTYENIAELKVSDEIKVDTAESNVLKSETIESDLTESKASESAGQTENESDPLYENLPNKQIGATETDSKDTSEPKPEVHAGMGLNQSSNSNGNKDQNSATTEGKLGEYSSGSDEEDLKQSPETWLGTKQDTNSSDLESAKSGAASFGSSSPYADPKDRDSHPESEENSRESFASGRPADSPGDDSQRTQSYNLDVDSDSQEAKYLREEEKGGGSGPKNVFDTMMSRARGRGGNDNDRFQTTTQRDYQNPSSYAGGSQSSLKKGSTHAATSSYTPAPSTSRTTGAATGAKAGAKAGAKGAKAGTRTSPPIPGATASGQGGAKSKTGGGKLGAGQSQKQSLKFSQSKRSERDTEEYQRGYPGKRDDKRQEQNYRFYFNQIPSYPQGDYIDKIHEKWFADYERLERHHGYIQWLFPIREQGMNYSAQELQPHEIEKIIKDPKASERVLKSYCLMLDFYGMELVDNATGEVKRAANWESRSRHLNKSFHNYLRITRILKCLGELGYQHFQFKLVEFFLHESIETGVLHNAADSCLNYWIHTVRNEQERGQLMDLAHELSGKSPKRKTKNECSTV